MLIAAVPDWLGFLGLIFGLIGTVVTAAVVVLGSRTKTVANQQDQAISALEARVGAQDGEIADLRRKSDASDRLLAERDRRIDAQQIQINQLTEQVTQKAAVKEMHDDFSGRFDAVFEALKIPISTGGKK